MRWPSDLPMIASRTPGSSFLADVGVAVAATDDDDAGNTAPVLESEGCDEEPDAGATAVDWSWADPPPSAGRGEFSVPLVTFE